jgi:hypothetical protein
MQNFYSLIRNRSSELTSPVQKTRVPIVNQKELQKKPGKLPVKNFRVFPRCIKLTVSLKLKPVAAATPSPSFVR